MHTGCVKMIHQETQMSLALVSGLCSQYGDYDNNDGADSGRPSTPRGRLGAGTRNRVQFARRSRGLGQGGGSRTGAGPSKENSQDYMSKAKQLWNYVGKVRPFHSLFVTSLLCIYGICYTQMNEGPMLLLSFEIV